MNLDLEEMMLIVDPTGRTAVVRGASSRPSDHSQLYLQPGRGPGPGLAPVKFFDTICLDAINLNCNHLRLPR